MLIVAHFDLGYDSEISGVLSLNDFANTCREKL